MPYETRTRTEKGISLARGPAHILGTILLIAGLFFLYKQNTFPKFSQFPNGHVTDTKVFFGIFGINGWTGMLTAVAGGLLLFGAAQHLLAKTTSLIVAIGLGAAAIIALISGRVLGMAAANIWTEIGWLVCAVILLFNTMIPRRRRVVTDETAPAQTAYEPAYARRDPVPDQRADDPVTTADQTPRASEPPVVEPQPAAVDSTGPISPARPVSASTRRDSDKH